MFEILVEGMTNNKGGKESYIINVFNSFDRERFHFSFIAYDDRIAYEDYLTGQGAIIIHLPPRNKGLKQYRKELNQLFSNKHYDVFWSHKTTLSSCEAIEIAKKAGVPLRIVHSHSSSNMGGKFTFVMHSINKLLVRRWANEFFACSDTAAKWFFGNKPCRLIPNGIDVEKFKFSEETRQRVRKNLNLENCFVIGHVGRFGKEKKHKKLIDVFNEVHKQRRDARLVLCGDGEERRNIEQQIADLGIADSVMLLGVINNVNEVLQAVDVIVMPSLFEGLPFALLEAQCTGLRCVVSDTVSRESDVLGWNVFLPLDVDDKIWADEVMKSNDPPQKRENAADKIKESGFDIYDCVSQIESIIEKMNSYKN